MREMKKNDAETNTNSLCMDFDVNWLMMNKTKSNDSAKQRVDKNFNILKYFSSCGIECAPMCDPEHLHHSKRVSVHRKAERFVKDIKIKISRSKLIEVTHKLQCNMSDLERNKLNNEKKNLTKIGNSNAYGNIVTFEMIQILNKIIKDSKMHVPNEAGVFVNEIIIGMH